MKVKYYDEINQILERTGQAIISIGDSFPAGQGTLDVELYKEGLLSVDYDENLEATFTLSPEGTKKAKDYGLIEILNKDIPND